jgi:hypothetical protein
MVALWEFVKGAFYSADDDDEGDYEPDDDNDG